MRRPYLTNLSAWGRVLRRARFRGCTYTPMVIDSPESFEFRVRQWELGKPKEGIRVGAK